MLPLRIAFALAAASLAFAGGVPDVYAYITPDEFIGSGAGGGNAAGSSASSPSGPENQKKPAGDGTAQADRVQVDCAMVPLPPKRGAGTTRMEDKEDKENKEQIMTVLDRSSKTQERMMRRLEDGESPAISENIPLPTLIPEPVHSAAPPEPARSVREQIARNPLPQTGMSHEVVFVLSALVLASLFLPLRRWLPRRI